LIFPYYLAQTLFRNDRAARYVKYSVVVGSPPGSWHSLASITHLSWRSLQANKRHRSPGYDVGPPPPFSGKTFPL